MHPALLTLLTAILMEPVAAAVHRLVGHGPGWVLHRDHHAPRGRFERNDLIPVVFAAIAMVGFAIGVSSPGQRTLVWIALGVTIYGASYAFVHDIYIHRRLPLLPERVRWLEPLRVAHLEHHRQGGAPFGVLVPLRPVRVRRASIS